MDSQFDGSVADELYDAAKLISQNRYKKAEPILRDFLNNNPLDVNAMRLLADVGIEFRAYKEAGYLLNRALDLAPNYHHARFSYANLLYKRQLPEEALLQIEILLKEEPENMQWLSLKAVNFALANQHEKATELFELIIQKYPANNQIYLSYGHALRAVGKIPEAIAAYKKAISFRRGVGEAYWSLANLKTFIFLDEDIEAIKKVGLAKGGSLDNAIVVKGTDILNKDGLRNSKEFVNHKILDCIGDLFTSGYRIIGSIKCSQGGHYLTNQLLRKVFSDNSNFSIIEIQEKNLPHTLINRSLLRSIA